VRARGRSRLRGGTRSHDGRELLPESAQTHLLSLQASAGNAAVAGLLQRQPKAGWSDADTAVDPTVGWSWNKERHPVGSVWRYPLQNLPVGNQRDWTSGASAVLTGEGAKGKAIGLVPEKLDPDDPVTVLIHLHGYAEKTSRPYAGWRQHKTSHKVRDVEHDRIAQQIEATRDPQIIGVLPQGGEQSQFGMDPKDPYNTFGSDGYVKAVLKELARVGALAKVPAKVKVVVSAHSGGGHTVASMLAGENEKRAGFLPIGFSSAPSSLGGVMLFDAMTWSELKTVKEWVLGELNKLLAVLSSGAKDDAKQKAIDDAPRFRGYYTLNETYVAKYEDLDQAIRKWFRDNGGALGTWADKVWPLFQVVPWGGKSGETHETIVRGSSLKVTLAGGNLTEALKAVKNPTALTPRPLPPPPKPPPKPKSPSSSRTRSRRGTRVP
jgi:hypothetical protein